MPRLHIKDRKESGWYHLFNQGSKRGRNRPREVFIDREDKRKFLSLIARHLGQSPKHDPRGRPFVHLQEWIVLVCFNIMTTHFHLIVWQRDPRGIAMLMSRVKADYTRYFNAKYGSSGPLFNGPVQSKPIGSSSYQKYLVGYVHKNWRNDEEYAFSSHRAWVDEQRCPGWIDPELALQVFGGVNEYREYLLRFNAKRSIDAELGYYPGR